MPGTIIAAAQISPVFLDKKRTIAKACDVIADAAKQKAKLVLFPEAFIPCYPDWVWTIPAGKGGEYKSLHAELHAQSVTIGDDATMTLCKAAKKNKISVAIGINEKDPRRGSSLFNSLLYIHEDGRVLGVHRKLVPTAGERLVWAGGDGSTLEGVDLPFARVGGLICWENYMPLARYAMYAQGISIYLAPTWDHGDAWLSTIKHIAREGRTFVIGCGMPVRKSDMPEHLQRLYPKDRVWINPGGSAIVDPSGRLIAGPIDGKEEILFAEFNQDAVSGSRWDLDVVGHYSRPDVFHLSIDKASNF